MDSNTKIIILVLILVFIKYFIPNIDNFDNTTTPFKIFNPTFKVYLQRINSDTLVFTPDKEKASYFYINNHRQVVYSTSSVIDNTVNIRSKEAMITNNGWNLDLDNNKMKLINTVSSTNIQFDDKNIFSRQNMNKILLIVNNNYSYGFFKNPQLDNNNSIDFEKIYE